MVKKIIIICLLAIMPIMSFAEDVTEITSPRVAELIAQKQAKMQKLSKCKGTTKKLKIAGLSTLGISAVGVAANVVEAVILKEEKGKLNKATSDAVEALCKGEKGLQGDWDSTNKECKVKAELLETLPAGITCNDARTECSSGDIKVKIRVKIEPVAPIEYEVPVKEEPVEAAPAEDSAEEAPAADAPGGGTSGGDGSGEGASDGDGSGEGVSGGDAPAKEESPVAEEAPAKEESPVAEEAPAEEVSAGDVVTEEASSAQATEVPAEEVAPTQSEQVSPEDNKPVPEIKKTPRRKIKQDKRSNNSIKSAKMYAESTLSCDIYDGDTDTLRGGAGKCGGMSPGSWIVENYNGKKDTGRANCMMGKTCYCAKDSTGFEKLDNFDSWSECANECAFMCVMYWYHDD